MLLYLVERKTLKGKSGFLDKPIQNATIQQLKAFYACAYFGSRTTAAEKLGVTNGAISNLLAALENLIEAELLIRKPSGFQLTDQGELLYAQLDEFFSNLAVFNNEIKKVKTLEKLRVYTTTPLGSYILADAIVQFRRQHPGVSLAVNITSIFPDVHLGGADIVIWPCEAPNKNFIAEKLASFHSKLFASEGYLKLYGTPKTIEELKKHELISIKHDTKINFDANWHIKLSKADGRKCIEANNSYTAIKLCEAGGGISLYSARMVDRMGLKLINVLPELQRETSEVNFIYHKTLKSNSTVRALYSLLKDALK